MIPNERLIPCLGGGISNETVISSERVIPSLTVIPSEMLIPSDTKQVSRFVLNLGRHDVFERLDVRSFVSLIFLFL